MIHKASCSNPADSGRRANNLLQSLREKRLISLYIEPSSRCNLACRFCGHRTHVRLEGIEQKILTLLEAGR
ncbi:MAG: hypothetical protein FD177_1413 [Desulfovibrionaceae bacterium]|nr:MAG: hypothetical protein FD177_1413 [Desulfovibrionaceae bacterium]